MRKHFLLALMVCTSFSIVGQVHAQAKRSTKPALRSAGDRRPKKATNKKSDEDKKAKAGDKEMPGAAPQPPSTLDSIASKVETPYRPKAGGYRVKFNLEDANLAELVNHISGLTGRRFIYGAKVRQIKVTVVSPTPVTLDEAYEAFLSILQANGMTVVPHGRFLKIIDSGGAVSKVTPLYGSGAPVPNTDRMLTRLYRLEHTSPGDLSKVLSKFKSKEGDISVYEAGQLLIITDTGSNVRRMIRLIEELDLGGVGSKMWVEPVHYSDAKDLAKQLNDIYELGRKKGDSGGALERVVADEQTNSLIIVGTEESYLRLLELLKRIDVAPLAEGRIHVLALQHADADDLSKTLTRMLGGKTSSKKKGSSGAPVAEMFEGDVRITADKSTNSLIVSSSARDYSQLRLVIEQLDQPRRQVFLEAVIMDVSVDRSSQLGLAYHGGAEMDLGGGEDSVFMGGFNPIVTAGAPSADQLQALALGVTGPRLDTNTSIPGIGTSVPAFGVFLNALAASGDSNVLSTPHIIATDNIEAEINVGENVPLQTNFGGGGGLGNLAALAGGANGAAGGLGGLAGALGGLSGGFNAQRTDVGTKIKITPHINAGDQIRLEIEEEISETGAASGSLGAVSITQRRANTTVVVDDQQTVVIGGLMRETKEKTREKIPVLGDLPVLGFLFRKSTERTRKTNLLLILTPYVIRDQADLKRIFERKMQERQEFLDRYFVFTSDWDPPRDFTRANGLVESVRQEFFGIDEQARRRREAEPREVKFHDAGAALELAGSIKGKAGGGKATPAKAKGKAPKAAPAKKAVPKARKKTQLGGPLQVQPVARRFSPGLPVAALATASE